MKYGGWRVQRAVYTALYLWKIAVTYQVKGNITITMQSCYICANRCPQDAIKLEKVKENPCLKILSSSFTRINIQKFLFLKNKFLFFIVWYIKNRLY